MLEAAVFFQGFPVLIASFLRQVLQTYSEICIFCGAIQYIVSKKQPVGSAHEVLVESSKTFFDEAHFIVNLHSFLGPLALPQHTFPPSEPFVPPSPQGEQLPKHLSSRHIRNSLSVYLFLNSQPQLGKSKEFNNQGLKIEILNVIFLFCRQTTIKNRQALHEIIRPSSLSIIFTELSFKPVYPTMVVKNFKFMENYNSWKIYLQVKLLTLVIFIPMQFSPGILKFGIKHVVNPLTLNC